LLKTDGLLAHGAVLQNHGNNLNCGTTSQYPSGKHDIPIRGRVVTLFCGVIGGALISFFGVYVSVDLNRRVTGYAISAIGFLLVICGFLLFLSTNFMWS
jgi:hypothetical protein